MEQIKTLTFGSLLQGITSLDKEGEIWWLDADSTPDKWRLKQMVPGSSSSYFTVNWPPVSRDITPASAHRWKWWQGYSQRLACSIMESDKTDVSKTSTLSIYCREVRAIAEWFCFSCGLSSVQEVNRKHIDAYEQYLSNAGLAVNTVSLKLSVLSYMFTLSREVGDGLVFSPYMNDITGVAKKIGRKGQHTKTIFPKHFLGLIDFALEKVADSERVIDLLGGYLAVGENVSRRIRGRKVEAQLGVSVAQLKKEVRLLYCSAILVIMALTAMRKHEASSISYDDAIASISSEGYISGVVHKTAGTQTGQRTSRPVPKEVINSLSIIVELTNKTRAVSSNSDRLLLDLPFGYGIRKGEKHDDTISTNKLYKLFDFFSEEAGFDCKLRPHMMRRAFSMMWSWRFDVGDLEYLSSILYHNDYRYTKSYVDDEDVEEFLDSGVREYTHDYLERVLVGDVSVVGGINSTLRKYKRIFHAKFHLISPDRVSDFVDSVVARHKYRVIPNADGYCFINPGRGSRAKCSSNGRKEDYSNRSEVTCASCPNFGVDSTRREYWMRRRDAHIKVMSYHEHEKGLMYEAASEGAKRAEGIVRLIDREGGE
ncbi:tyrosine-type recombinase/integrase [Halomonas halodenitrificans]|uniref:tyrosine-type recombinase/integrase n=1 Tax=Halomonas halodenitrificans TaxID=28252 RepID=UPI0009FF3566|nr:tyrosine-type recombinase/integrase [Halomonas halodenitrificans]